MAITRTQIAKQLLANGGRIGLRSGGPQDRGDEAKGTGAYGGPPGGGATQRGSGRDFVTGIFPKNNRLVLTRQYPKLGIEIITFFPILNSSLKTISGW